MIDPLSLAVGAGILFAGFLAGRFGRRPRAVAATCSCGHGLAYHDRQTGHCYAEKSRDMHNYRGAIEWVRCSCRRYIGPEPLADIWIPPIANGSPDDPVG